MHSFLQTTEWLDFQKSLGRQVWRYDQEGVRAGIILHKLPFGLSYLYVPYGPEINFHHLSHGMKNSVAGFFAYIQKLAHEHSSVFVKIEPRSDMVAELLHGGKRGFRWAGKHVQPHKTQLLALSHSEDELLGGMHHKVRYNINLAIKKGVTFKESHELDTFWALLKKTTEQDGFTSHPREYYEKLLEYFAPGRHREITVRMFLVYQKNVPLAGALVLEWHNHAYYLHGASDRGLRALMGPHLMHWAIIKRYKSLGFTDYDFWGIDDNKWPGVTRFKLGFGGRTVEYPGSFDMPTRPWLYRLYRLKQKFSN